MSQATPRDPKAEAVGVMLPREVPPDQIARVARACEAAGFDEIWVVEDCFFTGGLTTAALALAATERVVVGIGILPAVVRNAAFTAMELATLAGAFPGRVHAGLGHGLAPWMAQIGATPDSWLAALRQMTTAVRDLLHGQSVTSDGDYVQLTDVRLEFAPQQPPLLSLGVRGPRSVALAGKHGDGLILAEPTPPTYIGAARARLDQAAENSTRQAKRRLTAYTWALVGDHVDAREADALLRGMCFKALRHGGIDAHIADLDADMASHLRAVTDGSTDLSDEALDLLVLRGEPSTLRAGITARHQAGADSVVLIPPRATHGVDVLLADIAALGSAVTARRGTPGG